MRKDLRKKVISSLVIFLFFFLPSCGWLKREQITKQMGNGIRQAELELEAREFQRAIDIYKKIYREYPQDSTVRSGYIKALESIKSSGDRAFERDHFELAGNIYEILAKNWSGFADFGQSLSFNRDFLEKKVRTSRILFDEKQARLYLEAGEFQKAIDVHNEIYRKHPHDPPVRSGYIKTLESIKSSGDRAFERNNFELAGNIYEILAKNWSDFADFSQSLSFNRDFLEKKIKTSRSLFSEKQAKLYLGAGEFQKAIDVHNEIYRRYPQDSTVRSHYIKTLESIKSRADRAFKRSDFAPAGCIYSILLKNFSSVTALSRSISFDRRVLTAKVRSCKKILFASGLEQYRSGNLNQAISIWKSILAFDPENQEIKRAVEMATLQSKNLEKAKP